MLRNGYVRFGILLALAIALNPALEIGRDRGDAVFDDDVHKRTGQPSRGNYAFSWHTTTLLSSLTAPHTHDTHTRAHLPPSHRSAGWEIHNYGVFSLGFKGRGGRVPNLWQVGVVL